MNKRDLQKSISPSDSPAVERKYEPSEDGRRVTLTFTSDKRMSAIDLLWALCDFVNDFVALAVKGDVEQ